jgi:hypothetical protein
MGAPLNAIHTKFSFLLLGARIQEAGFGKQKAETRLSVNLHFTYRDSILGVGFLYPYLPGERQ